MLLSNRSKEVAQQVRTEETASQSIISLQDSKYPMPDAPASNSAFKTLLVNFLATGGDSAKLDKKYKKPMRCAVREIQPQFILTDGQYLISGYMTRDALTQYIANKENTVKVSELRDYMITIDNWSLELVQVAQKAQDGSFTSYLGLEMRLIIHKFSQYSKSKVDLPNRFPTNLYRNEYACACIQNFLLSQQLPFAEQALKSDLDQVKSLDRILQGNTSVIKVKSGAKASELKSTLSIQKSAKEGEIFTDYPFLKTPKTEVLSMKDVIISENNDNPKMLIKKLVQESKKRMKEMEEEIGTDKPAKTKSTQPVKQKKSLKISNEKAEISTELIKKGTKRSASAASKKSAATPKTRGKATTARASAAKLSAATVKQARAASKSATAKKAAAASKAKTSSPSKKETEKTQPAKPRTPVKPAPAKKEKKPVPVTPEKKRDTKAAAKEEEKKIKSSGKKMATKDFKKFLADVQTSAISSNPMPRMSDARQSTTAVSAQAKSKQASAVGTKRTAGKATTQQASAASKRTK